MMNTWDKLESQSIVVSDCEREGTRMNRDPLELSSALPKLVWLEVTEIVLKIAADLFVVAERLHFRPCAWLATRLLRVAARALGHAPAHPHIEFRADLPVQI